MGGVLTRTSHVTSPAEHSGVRRWFLQVVAAAAAAGGGGGAAVGGVSGVSGVPGVSLCESERAAPLSHTRSPTVNSSSGARPVRKANTSTGCRTRVSGVKRDSKRGVKRSLIQNNNFGLL